MIEILFLGLLTAVAFWIVMMKMGIGRFVRAGWIADLVISLVMGLIFVGTFTGMATGLIAGICLSFFLWIAKWFTPAPPPNKK